MSIRDTVSNLIDEGKQIIGLRQVESGGEYTFPGDLNSSYYMNIAFYEYRREDLNSIGSANRLASMRLPIPNNLVDNYGANYDDEPLNTALAATTDAALGGDIASLGGLGVLAGVSGALGAAGAAAAARGGLTGLAADVAGAAASAGAPVASAMTGLSLNPFLTVMFKSPQYKQYNFSWRLYPKTNQEAQEIANMVTLTRYHMSPDRSSGVGGAILSWPSLVKCQIFAKGAELYPFKYGVIKDCAFNFAPDGAPSFFRDGRPTAVDFKVTIQEVEYFLKSSMGSS
jgi:hypothetical protein